MKYTSTRGGVGNLTFENALFTGYATDGGILVPEEVPVVSGETLKSWSRLGFVDLAKEIVSLFVPEEEIPRIDLNGEKTYLFVNHKINVLYKGLIKAFNLNSAHHYTVKHRGMDLSLNAWEGALAGLCCICLCSIIHLSISDLLDAAFRTFSVPEVAPVARLKDGLCVLELFHGKTWALKDLALSCVGQFYNYFCAKRKKHYTILVGMK